MPRTEPIPTAYRVVLAVGTPIMTRWGRLEVTGLEHLPASGPCVVVADHDSYWDPIAVAVAARRVRPVRALAKSTLWRNPVVGRFLDGMGQIPVVRGANNTEALARAVEELRAGACIGMFPEGTRSLGRELKARTGVARLVDAVPEAVVVGVRINGTTQVVDFPRRPTVSVTFFRPAPRRDDERLAAFSNRLLREIREGAPREVPGRRGRRS